MTDAELARWEAWWAAYVDACDLNSDTAMSISDALGAMSEALPALLAEGRRWRALLEEGLAYLDAPDTTMQHKLAALRLVLHQMEHVAADAAGA